MDDHKSTQEVVEQFLIQRYTDRQLIALYRAAEEIYIDMPLNPLTSTEIVMERLVNTIIPAEIERRYFVLVSRDDAGVWQVEVRKDEMAFNLRGWGDTIADALESYLDNKRKDKK